MRFHHFLRRKPQIASSSNNPSTANTATPPPQHQEAPKQSIEPARTTIQQRMQPVSLTDTNAAGIQAPPSPFKYHHMSVVHQTFVNKNDILRVYNADILESIELEDENLGETKCLVLESFNKLEVTIYELEALFPAYKGSGCSDLIDQSLFNKMLMKVDEIMQSFAHWTEMCNAYRQVAEEISTRKEARDSKKRKRIAEDKAARHNRNMDVLREVSGSVVAVLTTASTLVVAARPTI